MTAERHSLVGAIVNEYQITFVGLNNHIQIVAVSASTEYNYVGAPCCDPSDNQRASLIYIEINNIV